MRTIAHIINPVIVSESSNLLTAQPITFKTMQIAQTFAKGEVQVQLYSAQYPEDRALVPEGFIMTPDLDRSVLDFGTFEQTRKLPLLKDILDRLYSATEAEYLIYTNVYIALQANFYLTVNQIIEQGIDAFVINRRSIPDSYQKLEQIPLMYAQIGQEHGGHDCFIFPRKAYPHYTLGSTCIGMSRVGAVLLINLICNATRFKEFTDLHLIFHLGTEQVWRDNKFLDYFLHNHREWKTVLAHYRKNYPKGTSEVLDQVARRCSKNYFKQEDPKVKRIIVKIWDILKKIHRIPKEILEA